MFYEGTAFLEIAPNVEELSGRLNGRWSSQDCKQQKSMYPEPGLPSFTGVLFRKHSERACKLYSENLKTIKGHKLNLWYRF